LVIRDWGLVTLAVVAMNIADSGCWIEASAFSPTEMDLFLANFCIALDPKGRAGTRHLMSNQAVNELANDGRLLGIAREALGRAAVPFRATLFAKSRAANWLIPWHQDTALPLATTFADPEWASWSQKAGVAHAHAPAWALSRVVALRVHLDASTIENGPLRIVPGSQLAGVLTDEGVHDYVESHDQITCLVPRGGVLAMRPLLIHASSKADTGATRRVLHIEYADSLDLKPGIRLAVV
jgi:ectoine hydroxylase-related dioxygenase (phytanoyl-CoA dioxygenase family)